jgi:SAM-dependent methyltransferase
MQKDFHVAIIGGGIGGVALARSLDLLGIDYHVFERSAAFGEVGAGVQMTPNAVKVLEALGLAPELTAAGFLPEAMVGWNWQSAEELFRTPLREVCPRVFGADFWSWLAEHGRERALFDAAMGQGAQTRLDRLETLEWRGDETIVDVGGGNGSLLAEFLRERPGMRGIVFDLPETVRDESVFGDRLEFVAGSFFESVPPGDVHLLVTILHDWDDESAAAILRTIREAARPGSRLIVLDAVVPPGNEPDGAKWLDLLMLALFEGRERNEEQWHELLEAGGFEAVRFHERMIEARCRS